MSYEKFSELCQLDGLGLSCVGCCIFTMGYELFPRETILEQIKKNSGRKYNDTPGFEKVSDYVCKDIIFLDEDGHRAGCRIHPHINNGVDERRCTKDALCGTAMTYSKFTDAEKHRFRDFLKGLDFFEYSRGIWFGGLMEDFYADGML